MELTFQYFIFIKYSLVVFFGFAFYKTLVSWGLHIIPSNKNFIAKFKPKLNGWAITTVLLFFFLLISPIKMDVNTKAVTDTANQSTAAQKELPPMAEDDKFKQNTNAVTGITKQDLE
jgi:hypothetical protein